MPVRKIPKSYRTVTGLTATDKSGEMTMYESGLEHKCQKLVTFNTNVLKYEEQPLKIHFIGGDGKTHTYVPDLLIDYRKDVVPAKHWKPVLVEVKWRRDLFKNWQELKPKYRAARKHAKEHACDFSLITDKEIKTPYLDNAIFLLTFRRFPINKVHSNLLLRALEDLREADPTTLLRAITEERDKVAELLPTLWQLIGNRAIGVNLESRLTMRSRIWSAYLPYKDERDECLHQSRAGRSRRIRWRALRYLQHFDS